jgi:O-antigen/teichoic acid export membrane protein
MYSARYLGVNSFGVLSFALAFTGIFSVFLDFGFQQLITREVARQNTLAKKYVNNLLFFKLLLLLFVILITFIILKILNYPLQTLLVVLVLTIFVGITSISQTFNSVFQAFQKMEYVAIEKVLNSLSLLFGALIAIFFNFDVVKFSSIYVFTGVLALFYCFYVYIKFVGFPSFDVDFVFLKKNLRESLPFAFTSIFAVIYYYIDSVMLSIMMNDEAVGFYNAAYRLAFAFLIIPSAYFMALYPMTSKLFTTSVDSLKYVYDKSFKFMIIIGLMIALFTNLMAEHLIVLIFGVEFIHSVIALKILIWSVFFLYVTHANTCILNSINKQFLFMRATFVGMILNVTLNIVFIPRYSYLGASFTTLLTEILVFILSYHYVKTNMESNVQKVFISKILVLGVVISTLSYLLENSVDIVILLFVNLIIFMFMLHYMKILTEEDVHFIRKSLLNI